MNLGQLVGELLIKAHEAAEVAVPAEAPPPTAVKREGKRREQIVALIRERGHVVVRDLVETLGMTSGNASVTLLTMFTEGQLRRSGEPRHYEYTLP